ncbi:MAG: hypothetical protein C0459_09160 [Chitinophaga sp.]|jgi:hypothetical protein|nr:hypothetical protein [Chitinophaga sp.]
MNQLIEYIKSLSPSMVSIIGIFITIIVGLLAWITKTLIELPITGAKETFYKLMFNKIEILSELKSHLTFIAYFPTKQIELKEKIQDILLRDGKTAYIDSILFADIIKYSITEQSSTKDTLAIIEKLDNELSLWINKSKEENKYFYKFYSPYPLKRTVIAIAMVIWVFLIFFIGVSFLFAGICLLLLGSLFWKIVCIITFMFLVILGVVYLKK